MATWKKIIVSGSQAELAGITGSLLTNDKLLFAKNDGAVTSTAIDVNANGHLDGIFSGSFSGSFTGDLVGNASTATSASHALNADVAISASHAVNADAAISASHAVNADVAISASRATTAETADKVANSLTDGNGIADFTFDGSSAASVAVQVSGSTLTVDADGVAVNASGITTNEIANDSVTFIKIASGSVVTSVEGISNATSGSDDSIATTKAIVDYVDAQVGASDLDLSGDGGTSTAVDLNTQILAFSGSNGIQVSASAQAVGVSIADGGILPVKLDSTLAGGGLASTLGVLSVNVDDSSIEINGSDNLQVKALGITNAMLAGNIDNAKLVNDSIKIGDASFALGTTASLAATGFNSGSFSGSFQGDGSGLTGIATTLEISGSTGGGDVDLKTQLLTVAGGTNINTVAGAQTITVNLNDNISVTNATITGDLVVLGTASFQNETNLEVKDRFILLASGSSATGDGGIIVQQATQDIGEVFGFDGVTGTTRWGIGQAQNAASSSFTPEAFMAAVLTGNASSDSAIDALVDDRYEAKGNIFIGDDEGIWIFS